jgi:apolipoprotein N-acyltransferase
MLRRLVLAVAGGLVMDLGFPGVGWWPATLAGVALVLAAVDQLRFWRAAGAGLAAGLAFYLAHVSWSALYLGWLPWVALSVSQALSFALGAGLIGLSSRLLRGKFVFYPLLAAGLWTAREDFAARWPYGGFSWGRVAFSHSEGPLSALLSWIGASGLSFVLVAIAAAGFQVVRHRRWRPALAWAVPVVALAFVPVYRLPASGELTVGAVQGNGPAGYFAERTRGDLLAAQEKETAAIGGGARSMWWSGRRTARTWPLPSPGAAFSRSPPR